MTIYGILLWENMLSQIGWVTAKTNEGTINVALCLIYLLLSFAPYFCRVIFYFSASFSHLDTISNAPPRLCARNDIKLGLCPVIKSQVPAHNKKDSLPVYRIPWIIGEKKSSGGEVYFKKAGKVADSPFTAMPINTEWFPFILKVISFQLKSCFEMRSASTVVWRSLGDNLTIIYPNNSLP